VSEADFSQKEALLKALALLTPAEQERLARAISQTQTQGQKQDVRHKTQDPTAKRVSEKYKQTPREHWRSQTPQAELIQWLSRSGYFDVSEWWDGNVYDIVFVPFDPEPKLAFINVDGERKFVPISAVLSAR
jgi:hypothetical protein